MIGWEPVPAIPGGHEDVEKCTGPLCGALVRRSAEYGAGRETHDYAFHEEDKPDAIAAHRVAERLLAGIFRRFVTDTTTFVHLSPAMATLDGAVDLDEGERALLERLIGDAS